MSRSDSLRAEILLRALLLAALLLPNVLLRLHAAETPAGPLPFDIKPLGGNAYAVIDKPDTATFVPGHGDIGKAVDVHAFGAYLSDLRSLVESAARRGLVGSSLADAVLPDLKQRYGEWSLFDYFAARNIADTASELAGAKRIPIGVAPIG